MSRILPDHDFLLLVERRVDQLGRNQVVVLLLRRRPGNSLSFNFLIMICFVVAQAG